MSTAWLVVLTLLAFVIAFVIVAAKLHVEFIWTSKQRGFWVMSGDDGVVFGIEAVKEEENMKNKWHPPPDVALKQAMQKMDFGQKAQVMLSAVAKDLDSVIVAGIFDEKNKRYVEVIAGKDGVTKEGAAALLREVGTQMIADATRIEGGGGKLAPREHYDAERQIAFCQKFEEREGRKVYCAERDGHEGACQYERSLP